MALNTANVRSAQGGSIYVAPLGSTVPVDLSTAWDVAWLELGYIDDTGVEINPSVSRQDINAWQTISPVRRILTKFDIEFKFQCLELKTKTIELYFPSSTMTDVTAGVHRLDIPAAPSSNEMAWGFEWTDGTIVNRLVVPRGEVTDEDSIKLTRADAVSTGLTVSAYATSSSTIASWLSNDPAWSAS